jgi:GT2 family glycosyltransferase
MVATNMTSPKVSIVIVNWNGLDDTVECLGSLKKITYSNYDVIVVDNGSKGNDAQVLKERFGDYIHLIQNSKNYGFAGGANIGMKYALDNSRLDYVLLLNNDTVVDPAFLTEMVKVAEGDPTIGIVGAKVYYYDDPRRLQVVWARINLWLGRWITTPLAVTESLAKRESDVGQYDSVKEVDAVAGCCFSIKKTALENIGLLDENFFSFCEEAEYYIRARKANYEIVYVPKAKVWHKGGASTSGISSFRCYYLARNNFRFVRKHASRWQYSCFLVYYFSFHFWLMTGIYLLYYRDVRLFTSFYRGVRDGLFNSESGARPYRVD